MAAPTLANGVQILDVISPAYSEILTPEAMRLLGMRARQFEATRLERLAARLKVQAAIDSGALPINVGPQYLESLLRGNGCVPIYNRMEDAATAEISRAQVWQWVRHHAKLSDGRTITKELVSGTMKEELSRFTGGRFDLAAQPYEQMMTSPHFDEFRTLKAYQYV